MRQVLPHIRAGPYAMTATAKDLIRSAAECNPWNEPVPGEGRRADKSRVDGTAVPLPAGAMGILTRQRSDGRGDSDGTEVETGGRGVAKGSEKGKSDPEPLP
jgi:hypothetical protein